MKATRVAEFSLRWSPDGDGFFTTYESGNIGLRGNADVAFWIDYMHPDRPIVHGPNMSGNVPYAVRTRAAYTFWEQFAMKFELKYGVKPLLQNCEQTVIEKPQEGWFCVITQAAERTQLDVWRTDTSHGRPVCVLSRREPMESMNQAYYTMLEQMDLAQKKEVEECTL